MYKETWKQYKDTEYMVSNNGNIWSNKSGKELIKILDGRGYLAVGINNIKLKVHRLVATTFIPNTFELLEVNHKDGNKLNNNINNLEWVSHENNMRHAWENNLCKKGEDASVSILSNDDVVEIKKLFVEYKLDNTEIGKLFGVSKGTISKIRSKHTWKSVLPNLEFDSSSPDKSNTKKLTGEDIPIIRRLYENGKSLTDIGKSFGVHSGTISGIISGKTWKNY
jgi:hypothetical protein